MRAERGVRSPLADSRVHTRSFGADHSTFAPIHAMVLGVLTLFCGSKRDRAGGCLAAQRRDLKAAAPSQVVRIPVSMNTGSRRPERALASGARSRWAVVTDSCSVSFFLGVRQAAPAPLGAFSPTVPDDADSVHGRSIAAEAAWRYNADQFVEPAHCGPAHCASTGALHPSGASESDQAVTSGTTRSNAGATSGGTPAPTIRCAATPSRP